MVFCLEPYSLTTPLENTFHQARNPINHKCRLARASSSNDTCTHFRQIMRLKHESHSTLYHSLVSCLVESLSLRSGAWNVAAVPDRLAPCVALLALLLALALAPALPVELPAAFDVRWCKVALISQCNCMRIPLIAAFVCSISSLTRWLSLITIMLVRPSHSVRALAIRDTSSRRESCSVSRWWICESKGGWAGFW